MEDYQIILYAKCEDKLGRVACRHDPDLRVLVGHSNMLDYLHTRLSFQKDPKGPIEVKTACREIPQNNNQDQCSTSAIPGNCVAT